MSLPGPSCMLLSRLLSAPSPSHPKYISFDSQERISIKFTGSIRYQEQIKLLHFWQNLDRNKGTGYERKFQSTSIGFAAM